MNPTFIFQCLPRLMQLRLLQVYPEATKDTLALLNIWQQQIRRNSQLTTIKS